MNKKIKEKSIYIRLFKSLKSYYILIIISIISLLLLAIIDGVLYKFLIPHIIDKGFIIKDSFFLTLAPIYIISIFFFRGCTAFISNYLMNYVARNVVNKFRYKILNHIRKLPHSFFNNTTSGNLISKINYDTEQLALSITETILESLRGFLLTIAMIIVMYSINSYITLFTLSITPIIIIFLHISSKYTRKYSTHIQNSMGTLTTISKDIINLQKITKIFDNNNNEKNKILFITEYNKKMEMKIYFIQSYSIPLIQFIGGIALSIIVYLSTSNKITLSVGEFSGIFGSMISLLKPLKQIATTNTNIQKGIAAANSIFKLLDIPIESNNNKIKIKKIKKDIIFKNVSFKYNNTSTSILKNINFKIKINETLGIIGNSGSGKSTLISLLLKLYTKKTGNIFINNKDIKNIDIKTLRKQFTWVPQDILLFNDNILHNITCGNELPNIHKIFTSTIKANSNNFIKKLQYRFKTHIGENGINLSGGQKQKISLTRAFLKDSPIFILDEATSSLDINSDSIIKSYLKMYNGKKTIIIITHKKSILKVVDKILILKDGTIEDHGTHNKLKNNEYYKKILK